ncbi:MAG: Hsp20/alpha crystallin family protein [Bacteroidota bacterium]
MCMSRARHAHWGKNFRHRYAKKWWKQQYATAWGYPPVNVEEMDDRYEILFYAAGYEKGDFEIAVKDDTLTVKVARSENTENKDFYWQRNAFKPGNFERQFRLNQKIDKSGISARYEAGILRLVLPKLAGSETFRQDIEIN